MYSRNLKRSEEDSTVDIRVWKDWIEVEADGGVLYAGHELGPRALQDILLQLCPMREVLIEDQEDADEDQD